MAKMNHQENLTAAYRTAYLLAGYVQGRLTDEEVEELTSWRNKSVENDEMFLQFTRPDNIEKWKVEHKMIDTEGYLKRTKEDISAVIRKHRLRRIMFAAACSVGVAVLFILVNPLVKKKKVPLIISETFHDMLPGKSTARLQLADGSVVELNSAQKDTTLGNVSLHIQNAVLSYTHMTPVLEWHELSVGRKGFYQLRLPDGTNVWLNSSSSIRYPTQFIGSERRVYVTGESYFEVAKDKNHPFRVEVNGNEVEAVGTAFNINAYPDEDNIVTTLVEGKVKLRSKSDSTLLTPNHTATLKNGQWKTADANIVVATGWKNGKFVFAQTPLPVIMRELARWYDATIVFADPVSEEFYATISRDVPLSRILLLLEQTGAVHFSIDGNKIIVKK